MEHVHTYSSTGKGQGLNALAKMNRYFVILLVVVLQSFMASGQEDEVVKKETKYTLRVGYGISSLFFTPNFSITQDLYLDTNLQASFRKEELSTDLKIKPFLVKLDVKINERSSLGIQGIYNGYIASGMTTDSLWVESTQSYTVNQYRTKYVLNRFRVQLVYTRNFHHSNPRFESFFYTALGWSNKFRKYYENGTKVNSNDYSPFAAGFGTEVNFPVSIRLAYGLCINLSDRLGLHAEIGLGGPLLTIGLTTKF